MRRNSCTVVVLASPAPGAVLAATARSMNVTLIRPEDPEGDAIEAAAAALQRAGRSTSPYALVAADPLAAVAVSWQAMWDVARSQGPDGFELAAAQALSAWRAGRPVRAARLLPGAGHRYRARRRRTRTGLPPRSAAVVDPAAPGGVRPRDRARAAGAGAADETSGIAPG